MSISSEVHRTLVKSPPELWAELSDPASLTRHLGELGEIRITRVKPEEKVEWEAPAARGTVDLKPSGWGTKVTLSVIRDDPEPPSATPQPSTQAGTELQPPADGEPEVKSAPAIEEPAPATGEEPSLQSVRESKADEQAQRPPIPLPEPRPADEDESRAIAQARTEPRRGFLSRLFGRRRAQRPAPDPVPEPILVPESALIPTDPEPVLDPPQEQDEIDSPVSDEVDIATDIAQLQEQTTAMLTSALDRLGAAHHRPFSRA